MSSTFEIERVRMPAGRPPSWFIDKGYKMEIQYFVQKAKLLDLKGSAARIIIRPNKNSSDGLKWKVEWSVVHGWGESRGFVHMSDDEMRRAFALADDPRDNEHALMIAEQLGRGRLSAAEQGKFVRRGAFLNIPSGAATGLQGDPCVSVEINEDIRGCVEKLLDL